MTAPSIYDPCPTEGREGRHSLYMGGPGGKRDHRQHWQVCEACGANGPLWPAGFGLGASGDAFKDIEAAIREDERQKVSIALADKSFTVVKEAEARAREAEQAVERGNYVVNTAVQAHCVTATKWARDLHKALGNMLHDIVGPMMTTKHHGSVQGPPDKPYGGGGLSEAETLKLYERLKAVRERGEAVYTEAAKNNVWRW